MYGISPKGGSMRHSFLDSDVRLNLETGKRLEAKKDFVRNHFNKLGGSIKGLKWLLENTTELEPYRYFMTTPDIGVDKVSSHRYWPSNHYQCSDYETFKDFNLTLFKQGKGYVADGAFTSQGLQSPLVQHVLKWGEQSPFHSMLKIDGKLALGVFPDREMDGTDPYKHIGVRLVNPLGEGYDKNKPTYIQFYDDRLLSKQAQEDGKFHFDYDTAPADHYEITSHQDSVQPYAFEINPKDKKLKEFNGKRAILYSQIKNKGDFFTFPHFSIAQKNKVAGATFWDGNVDIIKMNLSNPDNNKMSRQGCKNARNYLFGVANYWTEAIQSHLILSVARQGNLSANSDFVKNNDISKELFDQIKTSIKNGSFTPNSLVLQQNKKAEDYAKNFPLQSLETSEELSAIFAQPQFNDELLSGIAKDKIISYFNQALDAAIPSDRSKNPEYRAYVAKAYANDILRSIYAYALNPNAVDKDGKINTKELNKVTLKSLQKFEPNSPKEERQQVIAKINAGLSENSIEKIAKTMKKELASISLEDFKLAEAVVLQGKGGLNWRFDAAKDIGDLDAVRDKKKTFNQIWNGDAQNPGVQAFWGEFVARIRQSNPSAYVINEVTSLGEFMNKDKSNMYEFDPQLAAAWVEAGRPDIYETQPVYAKQVQFLNETNSTTTSEYSKGFNSFSEFAGVNPEKQTDIAKKSGRVKNLKNQMEGLMTYNQPNSVLYSHMFVSNHDKPSVLHTLPLDMSIYMANDLKGAVDKLGKEDQIIVAKITDGADLKHICPMAVGVGLAMYKTIVSKESKFSKEEQEALIKSLTNLVLGKKDDKSTPNYKRAKSFGVKPYEITIKDVIKNAKITKNDKDLEEKTLDFHKAMLADSMIYFERMWQAMKACIGVPTLYGGSEFVQTGYETPSKNVYLGIRNEVLHDLRNDRRYKDYFDRMFAISGLYQKPGLGVLRDGAPVSLQLTSQLAKIEDDYNNKLTALKKAAKAKDVNDGAFGYFVDQMSKKANQIGFDKSAKEYDISTENGNHEKFAKVKDLVKQGAQAKIERDKALETADKFELWPIYRKNAKGEEAISIITNLGMPTGSGAFAKPASEVINHEVKSILIKDKNGNCPFENGTKLVKIDKFGKKDATSYVVKSGYIVCEDMNKPIKLNDTVCVFIKK